MLLDEHLQLLQQGVVFLVPALDARVHGRLEQVQLLGDNRVQHRHGHGTVGRGTCRTELKFVARERKRRGPVAVGVVQQHFWNAADFQLQRRLVCRGQFARLDAGFKRVKGFRQLRANEGRHDCWWRFVGTQAVVISDACNGSPHHVGVAMKGGERVHEEGQEPQVGLGVVAWLQKIHARVGAKGPVVVLP